MFWYNRRASIDDRHAVLWVVVITDRVFCVIAALLYHVYARVARGAREYAFRIGAPLVALPERSVYESSLRSDRHGRINRVVRPVRTAQGIEICRQESDERDSSPAG